MSDVIEEHGVLALLSMHWLLVELECAWKWKEAHSKMWDAVGVREESHGTNVNRIVLHLDDEDDDDVNSEHDSTIHHAYIHDLPYSLSRTLSLSRVFAS